MIDQEILGDIRLHYGENAVRIVKVAADVVWRELDPRAVDADPLYCLHLSSVLYRDGVRDIDGIIDSVKEAVYDLILM